MPFIASSLSVCQLSNTTFFQVKAIKSYSFASSYIKIQQKMKATLECDVLALFALSLITVPTA